MNVPVGVNIPTGEGSFFVIPGLVPGIQSYRLKRSRLWITRTSRVMTGRGSVMPAKAGIQSTYP